MTSVSSPLTLIGTLPNGYGDDLTSCSYPSSVLASSVIQFEAKLADGKAQLKWEADEEGDDSGYTVEYGTNIRQLKPLVFVSKKHAGTNEAAAYSFLHEGINAGSHYYRIKKNTVSSQQVCSDIKRVVIGSTHNVYIGPNPAREYIHINNTNRTTRYVAIVYDCTGKLMCSKNIDNTNQSVSIGQLKSGAYILHLVPVHNSGNTQAFKFIKL
jgi:hypothetical protein